MGDRYIGALASEKRRSALQNAIGRDSVLT